METLEPKRSLATIESPERVKLRELEESGLYVFHGTNIDVEELEPRQAVDNNTGPDDKPGIHASQMADYAIFMAVAAPLGHTSAGATESDDSLTVHFDIDKNVEARLNDQSMGWVYVFGKQDFVQRRPIEWISTKSAKPLFKIPVSRRDLPRNINIF
jgi:hypothetical protein